jgi:hypothetical protein
LVGLPSSSLRYSIVQFCLPACLFALLCMLALFARPFGRRSAVFH